MVNGRDGEVRWRRGDQVGGEEEGRLGSTTRPHGFTCRQRTEECSLKGFTDSDVFSNDADVSLIQDEEQTLNASP